MLAEQPRWVRNVRFLKKKTLCQTRFQCACVAFLRRCLCIGTLPSPSRDPPFCSRGRTATFPPVRFTELNFLVSYAKKAASKKLGGVCCACWGTLDRLVVAGAGAAVVARAAAVVASAGGNDGRERRLLVRARDDRGRTGAVHGLVRRPAKLQHGRW